MKFSHIFSFSALIIMGLGCSETKQAPIAGIDVNNLDTSVNPSVDFYMYANGGWLKNNPMPGEYSRYGSFDKLRGDNDKNVNDLVKSLLDEKAEEGSIAQKIGTFYASGMDSATIESEGIKPLEPEFIKIINAKNFNDIQQLIAYFHTLQISPLFNFYGSPDSKNSEMNIAQLEQGGLGLGDRDYYLDNDARSKEIRAEYVKHIEKMLNLAGYKDYSKTWAQEIMTLETRLAKASRSRVELRDPESNYNKMKLDGVQKLSPNINWTAYFKAINLTDPGEINIGQPLFFKEISNMAKDMPIETWKAYLTWNLINENAAYLSNDFVSTDFDFYGKFMSGKQTNKPRWRRVLATVDNILGEAVGQLYVEKYFPPSAKERVLNLVENLRFALGERIKKLDWMSDSTKQKALEKLAAIRVKIGYPDKWRDYSSLTVKKGSYVTNVLKGSKCEFDYELSKINKPVDHDRWYMTPQTVNAYYNPNDNEICFPAGILQPPFFFKDADDAVNYGAIGMVIGHEITHGFDDQGCQYDKKGNLVNWWTAEDSKRFKERAAVLVNQFNNFKVLDSIPANGNLTLGENIADLGGLNISFTALQKALAEKPAPGTIDGFTPEQRFFLAYARVWGQHITDKEKLRLTKEDEHSLGRYRVMGPLPNLPEFQKAFNVKPEDPMYLAPEKRAVIW
ncbi:MAG TPA: M13 family metallopeptidase [Bacteroidales bacterium]|nr:M13 family metallopeptidase [Bacteroidales bacterium]